MIGKLLARLKRLEKAKLPQAVCPVCRVGRDAAAEHQIARATRFWAVIIESLVATDDDDWTPSAAERAVMREKLRKYRCPGCKRVTQAVSLAHIIRADENATLYGKPLFGAPAAGTAAESADPTPPWYLQDEAH